jgi:AcrR family transcriptional regulator
MSCADSAASVRINLLVVKQVSTIDLEMNAEQQPNRRDADRTRTAVLDAAERLFAERGFDGVSLQAVGAEAGLSRGTPGYFFGSKDGLYRAVLERAFHRVQSSIDEAYDAALVEADAEQAIRGLVQTYLEFPPEFIRLVEREALDGGAVLQTLPERLRSLPHVVGAIDAVSRKHLREVDPRLLLVSIVALCWFPFAHEDTMLKAVGLNPRDPEFRSGYLDHITTLLLNGLGRDDGSA